MKKLVLIPILALASLAGDPAPAPPKPNPANAPVTRAEFNALKVRVARIESAQNTSRRSTNTPPVRKPAGPPK